MDQRFEQDKYLVRKKVFKMFGGVFHVYDENENLVLYAKQKAFKLKEDIRLYADESMSEELLTISTKQVLDFSATYDIHSPVTGEHIGGVRRKGMRSILRDTWILLDAAGNEIGAMDEDSMALALVRRFATNLVPQRFEVKLNGTPVCDFNQRFNPFVLKIEVDFSKDQQRMLDRRLGLGTAILLAAIEGRQGS